MPKALALEGQTFHRLKVIERSGIARNGKIKWLCLCECGNTSTVIGTDLTRGTTKSCGCYKNELVKNRSYIHGQSRTRIHNLWWSMITRCCDENSHAYHQYGAVGKGVHESWKDFNCFYEWSINNGYKDNLTLDRKDNNKGYSPDNCRWITMKEQQRNRDNNRKITINGVTKLLCEWSEETGVNYGTLLSRIKRGFPEDQWLSMDNLVRRDSKKQSGVKYVNWHDKAGKWTVELRINGTRKYLGLFNTVEEAKEAIKAETGTC